jgi:hypothetical protein
MRACPTPALAEPGVAAYTAGAVGALVKERCDDGPLLLPRLRPQGEVARLRRPGDPSLSPVFQNLPGQGGRPLLAGGGDCRADRLLAASRRSVGPGPPVPALCRADSVPDRSACRDGRLPLVRKEDLGLRRPPPLPLLRQAAGVAVQVYRDGDGVPGLREFAPRPRRRTPQGAACQPGRILVRLRLPGLRGRGSDQRKGRADLRRLSPLPGAAGRAALGPLFGGGQPARSTARPARLLARRQRSGLRGMWDAVPVEGFGVSVLRNPNAFSLPVVKDSSVRERTASVSYFLRLPCFGCAPVAAPADGTTGMAFMIWTISCATARA